MPENFIDGCFVYIHKKKLIILLILLSAVSIGFCFVVLPKIMADKPKKIIVNEPEMEDYSGKAVLIYKDSENVLYEGDMVDGHAEGFGMLYSENGKLIYEGGFSDDMYCGQGKLYAEDGSVIYIGLFEHYIIFWGKFYIQADFPTVYMTVPENLVQQVWFIPDNSRRVYLVERELSVRIII